MIIKTFQLSIKIVTGKITGNKLISAAGNVLTSGEQWGGTREKEQKNIGKFRGGNTKIMKCSDRTRVLTNVNRYY